MNFIPINSLKKAFIKYFYTKVRFLSNDVIILGKIPYFKLPKNGKVVFGSKVILNSDFKNSNTALTYRCKFVTGYDGCIEIGDNTMINGSCIVSYSHVMIGKNCQIASSTLISDTDFHPIDSVARKAQVEGRPFSFDMVKKEKINIGENVWVGWNCTILKGVSIGDNSVVAAGSVVLRGNYPPNSLIAGNPAKVVKVLA
jgi:acetyltransferase-like isoleucine patch superfamily enzyme